MTFVSICPLFKMFFHIYRFLKRDRRLLFTFILLERKENGMKKITILAKIVMMTGLTAGVVAGERERHNASVL